MHTAIIGYMSIRTAMLTAADDADPATLRPSAAGVSACDQAVIPLV